MSLPASDPSSIGQGASAGLLPAEPGSNIAFDALGSRHRDTLMRVAELLQHADTQVADAALNSLRQGLSSVSARADAATARSSLGTLGQAVVRPTVGAQKDTLLSLPGVPAEGSSSSFRASQAVHLQLQLPEDTAIASARQSLAAKNNDAWEEILVVAESRPSHKYIIRPTSRYRMIWDLLALILVLLDSVVLPYEISFSPDDDEGALYFFGVFFFSIDIVLNFLTGYYNRGVLVLNQGAIARNYLRTWFLLDFGSTVPFSLFFEGEEEVSVPVAGPVTTPTPGGGGGAPIGAANLRLIKIAKLFKLLRLMRLLRLLKFRKIVNNIEAYFNSMVVIHMFNILSIFLMILFFCHWNACLWWSVGHPESFFNSEEDAEDFLSLPKNTTAAPRFWTELLITYGGASYRWLERPVRDQYVFCFYWTLGVMRTMPSEVWPVSFKERLYTMCFMFVAFSMFAISVSKITAVFNKIGRRRAAFDERMAAVRMYMREKEVPPPLQERIMNYLEYVFNKKQVVTEDLGLLGDLSVQLKGELSYCFLSSLLARHPAFASLSDSLMRRVATISRTSFAPPGEVVVNAGEVLSALTLVREGMLLVVRSGNVETYNGGAYYGTNALFRSDNPRSTDGRDLSLFTAICESYVELVRVLPWDFRTLRAQSPHFDLLMAEFMDEADEELLAPVVNPLKSADADNTVDPAGGTTHKFSTSQQGNTLVRISAGKPVGSSSGQVMATKARSYVLSAMEMLSRKGGRASARVRPEP